MVFGRSRRAAIPPVVPPQVPPGETVWAVGDIHGQSDLFDLLATTLEGDISDCPGRRTVVLLGDYIDRGLGAARVIDRILAFKTRLAVLDTELVTLKGNHEDLLLRFIDQPRTGPDWMAVGGRETLIAYGLKPPAGDCDAEWAETSTRLLGIMPLTHLSFYESLRHLHQSGDYHFVHAGVRPGIALHRQSPDDMMWIRDAFLKDTRRFDKVIVHGHTPGATVYADVRRICLDTGSYATGLLTAMRFCGPSQSLVQAHRVRGKVKLVRSPFVDESRFLA